ncbi:MAG: hypothetical protein KIT09_32020 [Bryobacteraceae bacterium]|nr:hypothetical protein [Bryobacteraceae bacterium]
MIAFDESIPARSEETLMRVSRRTMMALPAAALANPNAASGGSALGYRPREMSMWDAWHIEHEGRAHMIYLQRLAPGSTRTSLEADTLGHAVSDDLLRWTELDLALGPGPRGSRDGLQPWTGSLVSHNGLIHLFYTMRDGATAGAQQAIGLATSRDLMKWERHPANPVIEPDPRWYVRAERPDPGGVVDCRDLIVLPDPDGRGWIGFYSVRTIGEPLAEGSVIAFARSKDLVRWEQFPPAFAPRKYACIEAPDVFELGGKWYMVCLTGHEYGNRGIFTDPNITRGTVYAIADRPEGPYRELEDDNVLLGSDQTTAYCCRSFVFQGERYAFCTEPVPGGAAVLSQPFLVRTDGRGHLRLAYSPRTKGWRKSVLLDPAAAPPEPRLVPSHYRWTMPAGKWRLEGKTYVGESSSGYQLAQLGIQAESVEIEARVQLEAGVAAGFAFGPAPGGRSRDLVLLMDAEAGCIRAARRPWFEDPWARQFPVELGRPYRVRVMIRPPRFEVFVDDFLALQAGMPAPQPDFSNSTVCLFVDRGLAKVSDLAVYRLEA